MRDLRVMARHFLLLLVRRGEDELMWSCFVGVGGDVGRKEGVCCRGLKLLRFVSPMGKSRDYLRRGHVQHPLVATTYWLQSWPSFSVSSIGVK